MCYDMQDWEPTPEEYIENYSFIDKYQIYTNGSKLISVFRVEQMLEHYYKERTCKIRWKHIGGDVVAGYCECGMELDRCHDYEPVHIPNYCSNFGVRVVGD